MNNKGFTLIELLATVLLLALVAGIGTYSIIQIMGSTNSSNYDLLIKNIKSGAEIYYQECKYGNSTEITCAANGNVTLGTLVEYGFITGNGTDSNDKYTIVNPTSNANLSSCIINVKYENGVIVITNKSTSNANCPTNYN